jgi:TatA/E family protein of Tat protein translocase
VIEGLFSPVHILVILLVALIVLGPGRLPEIGRQVGKASREYRRFQDLVNDPVRSVFSEESAKPAAPPPAAIEPATPAPAVGTDPSPTSTPPGTGATHDSNPR